MLSACPCEPSLSTGIDWRQRVHTCLGERTSFHKQLSTRSRRSRSVIPAAGLNEGFSASSGSYAKSDSDLEETRSKLNASLQVSEAEVDYVQTLHEAARKFQLAMEQHGSFRKNGWFGKSWLGVDQFSWIKPVAYQAAVHALLQAVLEIASRGEGRDRDIHIFVQRSVSRQLAPLEESINEQFSARRTNAEKWFWSQQHPIAVASFVEMLENDTRFTTVTSVGWEGASISPSKATDVSLITLTIGNAAAILKLGAAKLSCPPFFSTLMEEIGRLMNMLTEFIPIDQVYSFTSGVGLRDQFLGYFGMRAAQYRNNTEIGGEEGAFWVDLVQQLLRGSISRERIRTKLTSYDSIEVLERDLAVFGFFAALGRKSQRFLTANDIDDSDEQVAGLMRYLIGGSTLFYPQLASLNTYQLFVEVVCDEMEWLPFYPSLPSPSDHLNHQAMKKSQSAKLEAVLLVLNTCSRWIGDFLKYSTWVQQPAGVRATNFLLNSKKRLDECVEVYPEALHWLVLASKSLEVAELNGPSGKLSYEQRGAEVRKRSKGTSDADDSRKGLESFQNLNTFSENGVQQLELFDKELQGVDAALSRLECLLLEPEIGPGKRHLTAACTNLEKIRQLKKEVEALEASLRAKATGTVQAKENPSGRRQRRQKGNMDWGNSRSDDDLNWQQGRKRINNEDTKTEGIAKFLPFLSSRNSGAGTNESDSENADDESFERAAALALQEASTVSKEIQRFELLRLELMDLEKRIQDCAGEHHNEQEGICSIDGGDSETAARSETSDEEVGKGDMLSKSLEKIKETSTDVWRGTQLLATDVAAAMVLLKRSASGEELTDRERKILKRTLTDLASIIPIGFLMLLPVTAVGHAAILAAIQRYAPALIPSAYARERLDLMRQLEEVREREAAVSSTPLTAGRGLKDQ